MHASSGAEARLRASSSEFAAHARHPRARAHAPGGGRAGSRHGIRTRRRMQAGMDTCGLAHASEAAPGRQERRPARRRALAASPCSRRNSDLRVPIVSPIRLSQSLGHPPLKRVGSRCSYVAVSAAGVCSCTDESQTSPSRYRFRTEILAPLSWRAYRESHVGQFRRSGGICFLMVLGRVY